MDDFHLDWAYELQGEGHSIAAIARIIDKPYSTVYYWLKK